MKCLALILALCLMVGCNSQPEKTTDTASKQEKDPEKITAKDIENLKFTEYVLSPDANEAVSTWQRYQELMVNIEFLKKADFSFFGGKNELLKSFINDLKKDIPVSVASPAIKERLVALETKLLKFQSTLKLSNVKKKDKLKDIKGVLIAVSNLHLQINKKFELDSQIIVDPSASGL